ncbi:assimilatory nitrate reductase electron transfer subunit [Streptosporangium becharense]|uniref:Assimilatory nitrate reductase electron transfer subunit n=1 Tax=Streptosporangium becharense TaxID=1816182 RepID=A0A7W9IBW4_9ACTN|nr:FAD-dependent oxidoreductase [Streptosporangium becharense]MBB2913781.1 assimilatory nitrate reductase electron transfer subunit [Streptosporangium becharense]MBB5817862.1 assimilatory nitrate reductase electron transfer subunit [Streptosporangium becharense]
MTRIVVVGNGMAGARLVSEVRARDEHARLTVFGAETWQPYNRVLLSNVVAGTMQPDQVRLLDPSWYADHGVTAMLGVEVTAVDRETQAVITATGRREPYDVLVLATGSRAVVPPVPGAERAVAFRTLDDCRAILRAAGAARGAVVVGGGLLGIEAARGLAGRGLPVTLLHLAGHLMERQLDAEAGLVLGQTLDTLGVRTRTGVVVEEILDDGVRLAGGETVEADLVVLACGVRPVTDLARDAGLHVERGIVVDDEMRTDDPSVFAIGECAEHRGTVYGLVAPAWEQAAVVADLVTGTDKTARYRGSRLVTRLKAKSVELAAMGETHLTEDEAEVVRFSHRAAGTYRKLVIRDGRLVGAILLGETAAVGTLTQLFDRGAPLPGDRAGLLFPGLPASAAVADSPVRMPDAAKVCQCNNVTKGQIRACWESGARDVAAVAAATRATTGCGGCRDAVEGIVGWLCEQEGVPV